MAHMNRSGLPWLFHGHTLGIDGDRGAGGSGRFFRRSGASAADLFDQRFERSIGGGEGNLTLQRGLPGGGHGPPLVPGGRGRGARAGDEWGEGGPWGGGGSGEGGGWVGFGPLG